MIAGCAKSVEADINDVGSQSNVQRSDFADLDGLLVNSENFNAVFIQKNNKQWLRRMLGRLSGSPAHLEKLTEILVNIIVNERHPEWTRRSLKWLTEIVNEPQLVEVIRQCRPSLLTLISYATQLSGTSRLIETVSDMALKGLKAQPFNEISSPTTLLDTGYVFVDDSDDNFGIPKKRSRIAEPSVIKTIDTESDKLASTESDSEVSLAYDSGGSENENDILDDSSDDGVFDVEDETSISDTQAVPNDIDRSVPSNSRTSLDGSDAESENYLSSPDIEESDEGDSNCNLDSPDESDEGS